MHNRILVLTDLKYSDDLALNNAVALAKMIGASIDLFHVKKPIDIVNRESQLSAMRNINSTSTAIDKKMKTLVRSYKNSDDLRIRYSFAIGNIKKEISRKIEEFNPDLVVLGKRKQRPLKLVGDKISDYLFTIFDGMVLIAGSTKNTEALKDLKLGAFHIQSEDLNSGFAKTLVNHSTTPVKSFRVIENSRVQDAIKTSQTTSNIVEYVFEQNDNVINNISNYLLRNNLDFLFVERPVSQGSTISNPQLKTLIKNSEVSMLLTGLRKFELN